MTNMIKALLAGSALVALATPVWADVKSGVEAWERGDYANAIKEWRPLAIKGDADAQFNLAQAYRFGRGVPADLKQAENWYRKAAVQGHAQAEDSLGLIMFQNGDRKSAMPIIERSANRGDPRAQYVLGTVLFNGDLIARDWPRAYAYMTRASAAGFDRASASLAQMDQYIPLDQRQRGLAMAREIEVRASRPQLAAAAPVAQPQYPVQPQPQYQPQPQPVYAPVAAPVAAPAQVAMQSAPGWSIGGEDTVTATAAAAPKAEPSWRGQSMPNSRSALPSPRKTTRKAAKASAPELGDEAQMPTDVAGPVGTYPADPAGSYPGAAYPSTYPNQPAYPAQTYPSQTYPTQPQAYPGNESAYPSSAPSYETESYPVARPAPVKSVAKPAATPSAGNWRIQLGAFSAPGSAQNLWQGLKGRVSALSGKQPYLVKAGAVTRLQAGGYASRAAADAACASVRSSGNACMVVVR